MNRPVEKELERLEDELANCVDAKERRLIELAIRDIEREEWEEQRWREEGEDRGWG